MNILVKEASIKFIINLQERRIDIQPAEDEEDPDDGLRQKDRKKIKSLQQNRNQIARKDKKKFMM